METSRWSIRRVATYVAAALGICALGCATILSDTDEEVTVESEPKEATVTVNGKEYGETPTNLRLDVDESHTIKIEKEGYESKTYRISNEIGVEWVILDVVFGVIPILVDAATGAWYKLEENYVTVTLKEKKGTDASDEGEVVIHGAERIEGPFGPMSRVETAPFHPMGFPGR